MQYGASLLTVRNRLLAIGGSDDVLGENLTAAIHCYDGAANTWSVIGQLPSPLWSVLTAVLPNTNELIVAGGMEELTNSYDAYITKLK